MRLKQSMKCVICIWLLAGVLTGCKTLFGTGEQEAEHIQQTGSQSMSTQRESLSEDPETANSVETTEAITSNESMETTESATAVDSMLQEMTLREKIGQLFIIRPDALDQSQSLEQINNSKEAGVTTLTEDIIDMLSDYPVGGIVMFSKNITSPEQITAFNEALQSTSHIPLLISVDEEGGTVSRLANHSSFDLPQYESAAAVGASGDASEALEMGSTIGGYLKEYGFNMDFAPDADVNTNPDNPVIGTRAFSSDANIAAQMAAAMAEGLKSQGIIPVFKHFPGHGDTAEDSHSGIAISYKTEAEMMECEWLPFQKASSEDCVMVGHIAVPNINGDLTPATMSYQLVSGILKDQLNFQGLVITDSLTMKAITDEYDSGEAAVGAIQAGCDMLLMPMDLQEAFDAIVTAAEDGSLSEQRLDESVRHILQVKLDYGILSLD